MSPESLLGFPLEEARLRLGDRADHYRILRTEPQKGRTTGELRIVRITGDTITVAPFYTALTGFETRESLTE